jgi:hypothetical protein
MNRKIPFLFSIVMVFALLLSACGAGGTPAASNAETTTGTKTFIARLSGAPDSARVLVVVAEGKFDA